MKSYTGATLLLNEDGRWWLFRGVPNDYTVLIDTQTGKAIDALEDFYEPWQVPALGGMPTFTDTQVVTDRLLPKSIFSIKDATFLKEEPAYSKGQDAFIYVRVESTEKSDHHLTETDEWRLFSPDELKEIELKTSDYSYDKPTFKFMATLSTS